MRILIGRNLLNLYAKVRYNIPKKLLLNAYENASYRINMAEKYSNDVKKIPDLTHTASLDKANSNTIMSVAEKGLFDQLDLPFTPITYNFFEYSQSDLFIHKDNSSHSRLGIVLRGWGDLIFYDDDKKEIARTDMQDWTIFTTKTYHSVEHSQDRFSFVIGFKEDYETLYNAFSEQGLVL